MKHLAHRSWDGSESDNKNQSTFLDQAVVMGGLAAIIFGYILLRFIYPLIDKGVLW